MDYEYRITKGWRFAVYASCAVTLPLFLWVGTLPFTGGVASDWSTILLLSGVSVCVGVLMGCALLETCRGKVILKEDRVITVTAFRTRELLFSQIKGYKSGNNSIRIVAGFKGLPALEISTYIEHFEDFAAWLSRGFPDLDQEEWETVAHQMMTDEKLGYSREEREQKLHEARRVAGVLNYSGLALCLWAIVKPVPYELPIALCLSAPLLVLLAMNRYKGFIRIDENSNSVHPSVGGALIFAACALGLRAVIDFEILQYRNLWVPVSTMTLLQTLLLVKSTTEFNFSKASHYLVIGIVALFMFAYCYGGFVILNCHFDRSSRRVYQAGVVEKWIDRDLINIYYLKLTPWGPRQEAKSVSVPEELYEQVQVGNRMKVYVREGSLDVPWFFVAEQ